MEENVSAIPCKRGSKGARKDKSSPPHTFASMWGLLIGLTFSVWLHPSPVPHAGYIAALKWCLRMKSAPHTL